MASYHEKILSQALTRRQNPSTSPFQQTLHPNLPRTIPHLQEKPGSDLNHFLQSIKQNLDSLHSLQVKRIQKAENILKQLQEKYHEIPDFPLKFYVSTSGVLKRIKSQCESQILIQQFFDLQDELFPSPITQSTPKQSEPDQNIVQNTPNQSLIQLPTENLTPPQPQEPPIQPIQKISIKAKITSEIVRNFVINLSNSPIYKELSLAIVYLYCSVEPCLQVRGKIFGSKAVNLLIGYLKSPFPLLKHLQKTPQYLRDNLIPIKKCKKAKKHLNTIALEKVDDISVVKITQFLLQELENIESDQMMQVNLMQECSWETPKSVRLNGVSLVGGNFKLAKKIENTLKNEKPVPKTAVMRKKPSVRASFSPGRSQQSTPRASVSRKSPPLNSRSQSSLLGRNSLKKGGNTSRNSLFGNTRKKIGNEGSQQEMRRSQSGNDIVYRKMAINAFKRTQLGKKISQFKQIYS